ncbi:MAG: AAA family ATPase [Actinobacteria bacterium]|nr:AAA family ATPase [Actinomycetota bacterium]
MIIKKLELENFKGIQKAVLNFEPGLNLIYGENEAGKSSVVEAIVLALFTSATSTSEKISSLSYKNKHKPFIKLVFNDSNKDWMLERNYEENKQILKGSDTTLFRHQDEILAVILNAIGLPQGAFKKDDLQKQFENLFIVSQERVEIEKPHEVLKFLLQKQLTEFKFSPDKAIELLKDFFTEMNKGRSRAAKYPGKMLKLEKKIQEKNNEIHELRSNLEEFKNLKKLVEELDEKKNKIQESLDAAKNIEAEIDRALKSLERAKEYYDFESRFNNMREVLRIKNKAISALSHYHFLSMALRFEEKLASILERFRRFKELNEELKKVQESIAEHKKEISKIPDTIFDDIPKMKSVQKLKDIFASLVEIENELKNIPETIEEDFLKAQKIEAEIKVLKKRRPAKAILKKINKDKAKLMIDGIEAGEEKSEFEFYDSLYLHHDDIDLSVYINPKEEEGLITAQNQLNDLLKVYGVNSLKDIYKIKQRSDELKAYRKSLLLEAEPHLAKIGGSFLSDKDYKSLLTTLSHFEEDIKNRYRIEIETSLEVIAARRRQLEEELARYADQEKKILKELSNYTLNSNEDSYEFISAIQEFHETFKNSFDARKVISFINDFQKQSKDLEIDIERYKQVEEESKILKLDEFKRLIEALENIKEDSEASILVELATFLKNKELKKEFFSKLQEASKGLSSTIEGINESMKRLENLSTREIKILSKEADGKTEKDIDKKINEFQMKAARATNSSEDFLETAVKHLQGKSLIEELNRVLDDLLSIDIFEVDNAISKLTDIRKRILDAKEKLGTELTDVKITISNIEGKLSKLPDSEKIIDLEAELEKLEGKLEKAKLYSSALDIAINAFEPARAEYIHSMVSKTSEKASRFFSHITQDKYKEIRLQSDKDGKIDILAHDAKNDVILKSSSLSRGAIDQLYLSLRISLAFAFFPNADFPFIFDESFSDFDENRLANSMDLLAGMIKSGSIKQILITPCHKSIRDLIINSAEKAEIDINEINLKQ